MLSPTRKKLDARRRRIEGILGALYLLCAVLWTKTADLDFAEGKKLRGTADILLAGTFAALGIRGVKAGRK